MAKPINAIRCNKHDLVEFSEPKTRHRYVAMSSKVPTKRSGITLIEMLVSVALSLLVVLAIVRIFEVLGTTVTDSRAILEMSAQLRTVANQLQEDLDRMTADVTPPLDPNSSSGFFEIIEGPDRDKDPKWGIKHDMELYGGDHIRVPEGQHNTSTDDNINGKWFRRRPNADRNDPNTAHNPYQYFDMLGGWYGDLDDVLMFTISSKDKPFVGRFNNRLIQSNHALVAWWVERLFDETGTPRMFRLHRRQLLIRPDLLTNPSDLAYLRKFRWLPRDDDPYNANTSIAGINTFTNENDLAVRPATVQEMLPPNLYNFPVPCTLADLSIRQNRFGHVPTLNNANDSGDANLQMFPNAVSVWGSSVISMLPRSVENFQRANPSIPYNSQNRYVNSQAWNLNSPFQNIYGLFSKRLGNSPYNGQVDFSGEDVLMTDVLAFDVRVYDPKAPALVSGLNTTPASTSRPFVLYPCDPGYDINLFADTLRLANAPRGAYVDLYSAFNNFSPAGGFPDPYHPNTSMLGLRNGIGNLDLGDFDGPPNVAMGVGYNNPSLVKTYSGVNEFSANTYENRIAVYDTWSTAYERDGINQDDTDAANRVADEATDGLDNNNNGQFDEALERETVPPYSAPLRGIEVTIRAVDHSSQQVRQVSIVSDF